MSTFADGGPNRPRDVEPRPAESLSALAYADREWQRRGRRRVFNLVFGGLAFVALFVSVTRGLYLDLVAPPDENVAECRFRLQHAHTADDSLRVVAFADDRVAKGCLIDLRARLR